MPVHLRAAPRYLGRAGTGPARPDPLPPPPVPPSPGSRSGGCGVGRAAVAATPPGGAARRPPASPPPSRSPRNPTAGPARRTDAVLRALPAGACLPLARRVRGLARARLRRAAGPALRRAGPGRAGTAPRPLRDARGRRAAPSAGKRARGAPVVPPNSAGRLAALWAVPRRAAPASSFPPALRLRGAVGGSVRSSGAAPALGPCPSPAAPRPCSVMAPLKRGPRAGLVNVRHCPSYGVRWSLRFSSDVPSVRIRTGCPSASPRRVLVKTESFTASLHPLGCV